MPRLKWDQTGQKYFETGTKNGVLFVQDDTGAYQTGVPWNGLTGFTESPTGAEATKLYADDGVYAELRSAEELEGSLTAYTYPDEFAECDGSAEVVEGTGVYIGQQARRKFAFCYRTTIGNDVNTEVGYKLHIIYGATASPSEKAYTTINDSPEGIEFSWDITTTPVPVTAVGNKAFKNTASIVLDSRKINSAKLTTIENTLYGTDGEGSETGTDSTLMLPDDIIDVLTAA